MSRFRIAPLEDAALAARLTAKVDAKTKPRGSLGRLESLAIALGMIQGHETPTLAAPHLFVFAADHGVAAEGVSAYPQDVTWQMVANYLAGGAAVNAFARASGMGLSVVDAGVAHDFGALDALIDCKVAFGTRNFMREAAMTPEQCEAALAAGAALVRERVAGGSNLIALGEMGIANTTAAAALAARFTGLSVETCVGRGTGIDDAGLAHKRTVVERALSLHRDTNTPEAVLAALGGFEIAMMAGAMLAAAEARATILIDGFVVTAALLAARAIDANVVDYCVYSHVSAERGHTAVLAHLGAQPLLDLGLRLGEGTGAALALPLLRAATAFLAEMASFESAGVAKRI